MRRSSLRRAGLDAAIFLWASERWPVARSIFSCAYRPNRGPLGLTANTRNLVAREADGFSYDCTIRCRAANIWSDLVALSAQCQINREPKLAPATHPLDVLTSTRAIHLVPRSHSY